MKAAPDKETPGSPERIRDTLNRALPEEENKWVRFAEEMHRESPLRGRSEELTARDREFRDRFSFDRGK